MSIIFNFRKINFNLTEKYSKYYGTYSCKISSIKNWFGFQFPAILLKVLLLNITFLFPKQKFFKSPYSVSNQKFFSKKTFFLNFLNIDKKRIFKIHFLLKLILKFSHVFQGILNFFSVFQSLTIN